MTKKFLVNFCMFHGYCKNKKGMKYYCTKEVLRPLFLNQDRVKRDSHEKYLWDSSIVSRIDFILPIYTYRHINMI